MVDMIDMRGGSLPHAPVYALRYPLCGAPNKPREACCLFPTATACPGFSRRKDTSRRGPVPATPPAWIQKRLVGIIVHPSPRRLRHD
jgi:hypothetical protein